MSKFTFCLTPNTPLLRHDGGEQLDMNTPSQNEHKETPRQQLANPFSILYVAPAHFFFKENIEFSHRFTYGETSLGNQ